MSSNDDDDDGEIREIKKEKYTRGPDVNQLFFFPSSAFAVFDPLTRAHDLDLLLQVNVTL